MNQSSTSDSERKYESGSSSRCSIARRDVLGVVRIEMPFRKVDWLVKTQYFVPRDLKDVLCVQRGSWVQGGWGMGGGG